MEKYEKEKLAKLKRNIGRRYLTVRRSTRQSFMNLPMIWKRSDDRRGEREFCDHSSGSESFGTMNFIR